MKSLSRRTFCIAAACAPLAAFAQPERWPAKPVHLLVPGGAGGVVDIRARWLADNLAPILGQPVIVDNRAGAGGLIGTEAGARSAPDGYTLVMIHQGTMAANPHMYAKLPYDALRDFAPITRLGLSPLVCAVNASLGVKSLKEFIALARERKAPLTFGSPGIGTPPHIAVELFKREAGIPATHVPYRGGGQSAADLLGGHIDFEIEGITVLLPYIRAEKFVALATTGAGRLAVLPDVPTMIEAGLPGYFYEGWVGIAAPAGTPRAVIDKAYEAIAQVLATPNARKWFADAGADIGAMPPDAFAAFIRADNERLGRVIREAGIKVE